MCLFPRLNRGERGRGKSGELRKQGATDINRLCEVQGEGGAKLNGAISPSREPTCKIYGRKIFLKCKNKQYLLMQMRSLVGKIDGLSLVKNIEYLCLGCNVLNLTALIILAALLIHTLLAANWS